MPQAVRRSRVGERVMVGPHLPEAALGTLVRAAASERFHLPAHLGV